MDVDMGRKIKVPNMNRRPTLENIQPPSQEDLRRVLNIANARERTAIAFIAFAGLRPEVLGSYKGTDGLRLRDLPEVKVKKGGIEIQRIPTIVRVPERLSKVGHSYITFLGPEGCEYLSAYLQERRAMGEDISPDSPIIVPKEVRSIKFIVTINIGDIIRKPMRRAGVQGPPYILRSYFATRTMMAESKGLLRDWKVFMMGHAGNIEHVYTLHKALPDDVIEKMRKGYEAALQYLETTPKRPGDDPIKRVVDILLMERGYNEEEIKGLDLEGKTDEEIAEILSKGPKAGNHKQRIVSVAELPEVLEQGCEFKAMLPDGKAIVSVAPLLHLSPPER
jgi:hypothetical protein